MIVKKLWKELRKINGFAKIRRKRGTGVGKIMTIQKLRKELRRVEKFGFVETRRKGDTGVGKTLEDLLGIQENNISLPDIGKIAELKASRKNAKSMLTLFTLEPQPSGGDRDRTLLDNFGYPDEKNRRPKALHSTVYCGRYNGQGLRIEVEKDKVHVVGKKKKLGIYWSVKNLEKQFEAKFPALVYVLADQRSINNVEHFHFNEAYLLKGFSFKKFQEMLRKDEILIDFRMYYKSNGKIRNHGTGFRMKLNKLYSTFEMKERLI